MYLASLWGAVVMKKRPIAHKPLPLAQSFPMHCNGVGYAWRGFAGPSVWTFAVVFLVLKLSQNSGGGFCSMSLPDEWLLDDSAGLAMMNDSGVSSCWPFHQKTL